MASVEIRIDVGGLDGIPHTFIVVTDNNGVSTGYGFAPAESGSLFGPGNVYDDTNHEYQISTDPMDITDQQFQDLMDHINDSRNNPPYYSVPGDWVPPDNNQNCSTWAIDALNTAGIPDVFGVSSPWAWNPYGQALFAGINDLWNQFKNWVAPRRDPLAIDLDGDGIETIGADGSVVFDHDGDGVKTGTGWVSADDALIVMDRNGNGSIDTGAELFGIDTVKSDGSLATDGFDALSDLDSNGDGVFDAQDAEFANVKIWQDLDQDGISDAGELTSLADAGIVSIDLNAESGNVNLGNGNVQTATSAHITVDGEEGTTGNLDLAHNPFYSEFTDGIPLTEEAMGLPDSRGAGMVRDLREAMSLSPGLASIVGSYAEQTSYSDQRALLDNLVGTHCGRTHCGHPPIALTPARRSSTLSSPSTRKGMPPCPCPAKPWSHWSPPPTTTASHAACAAPFSAARMPLRAAPTRTGANGSKHGSWRWPRSSPSTSVPTR